MKLEFGLMSGGGLCGLLLIHYCYSYYELGFFFNYSSGGFPPPPPPPKVATRYLPHPFSPLRFFKHLKFDGQKMHVMNCMLLASLLLLSVRRRLPAGLCCCYVAPFQLMPSYVTVIAPAKLLSLSLSLPLSLFLLWRQEEIQ
jgi:hypothetical protein